MVVRAYIGLGSNQQNPPLQIRNALSALNRIQQTELVRYSRLYRSKPMGPVDQPDFINAVAAVDTCLDAHALLSELQAIEQRQGRVRALLRWGPRTLDLDLLLYGDEQIDTERLTVPHPGLLQRGFVLFPLYEVAPELRFSNGDLLAELVEKGADEGLELLDSPEFHH